MLETILTFASTAGESEPSKTPFYVAGLVLTAWAIALFGIGMRSQAFPETVALQRGVIAVTAVLVAATMAAAIVTG